MMSTSLELIYSDMKSENERQVHSLYDSSLMQVSDAFKLKSACPFVSVTQQEKKEFCW